MGKKTSGLIVQCPHCKDNILISKLNCCIFRHGIFKKNLKQMHSHTPKDMCDSLSQNNLIYGCGKPFKIIKSETDEYIAVKCGYV